MAQSWKKGRGKLGPMAPLIGAWTASAGSPMGPLSCSRVFSRFGDGHVRLEAAWTLGGGAREAYRELAVFGSDDAGALGFHSFTNDGRSSRGRLVQAGDVPPGAIVFEADMPAGLARQLYWPDEIEGFHWAVEAQTRKGWRRFTEHHYRAAT
jgi:hypothetical protein